MSESVVRHAIQITVKEEHEATRKDLMEMIVMASHIIGSLDDPEYGDTKMLRGEAQRMVEVANRSACRIYALSALEWIEHIS